MVLTDDISALPATERGSQARSVKIGRFLMASAVLCTLGLIAVVVSTQSDDSSLVSADVSTSSAAASSLSLSNEAHSFQQKAKQHQRNAALLLREYNQLEAEIAKNPSKPIVDDSNKPKSFLSTRSRSHPVLAAVASDSGAAAAAPAAAASGAASVAAVASGGSAVAASGSAAAAASAGSVAAAASAASTGSAAAASASAVLPSHDDDSVRAVEDGDEAVPVGDVDLADHRPQEEDDAANGGAFNRNDAFSTAGDEFLTVKDLVKKVEERAISNTDALYTAKSKFADDSFVYAGSKKLSEPLVGFLGDDATNGLTVNPDGPAQPAHLSGNGLRDLFVPVGAEAASDIHTGYIMPDSPAASGSAASGSAAAAAATASGASAAAAASGSVAAVASAAAAASAGSAAAAAAPAAAPAAAGSAAAAS